METKHSTMWRWEDVVGAGIQLYANVPFEAHCVEFVTKRGEQPLFQLVGYAEWMQFPPTEWTEMQQANAEFIVRACNSHDALLAALRDMAEWLRENRDCECEIDHVCYDCSLLNAAKSAITLAEQQ